MQVRDEADALAMKETRVRVQREYNAVHLIYQVIVAGESESRRGCGVMSEYELVSQHACGLGVMVRQKPQPTRSS